MDTIRQIIAIILGIVDCRASCFGSALAGMMRALHLLLLLGATCPASKGATPAAPSSSPPTAARDEVPESDGEFGDCNRTFTRRLSTLSVSTAVNASFSFTNAMQSWTVPVGVVEILVDACGAQGGSYSSTWYPGGLGGYLQTTVVVTPLSSLFVFVGGQAGFNGGGTCNPNYNAQRCQSGGGAADIRTGASLSSRLVVAGGGGGWGYNVVGAALPCRLV